MNEIIFKPRYSRDNIFGALVLLLGGGLFSYNGYSNNLVLTFSGGGALFIMGVISLFRYPKEIIFYSDMIKIKKHLLPTKTIFYSQFSDISPFVIKFGKYTIPLVNLKNAENLNTIFDKLVKDGRISPSQFTGELAENEVIGGKALKYSVFPIIFLYAFLAYVGFNFYVPSDYLMIFPISFIAVYFGIYTFLKNKQRID